MEHPSSSKRVAAVGHNDDRDPVCDGIRVDGQWEHQPVCESTYQRGSAGACMPFIQGSYLHLAFTITQLSQLAGVVQGLMYMHGQEIIHGDLKGVRVLSPSYPSTNSRCPKTNILINNDGHACISDFSLLTITSDPQTFLSSCIEGGTTPWMSPELLDPESFGLEKSHPTGESDCYALGMVIYEVLNGRAPFAPSPAPVLRILRGDRPARPKGAQGTRFTDDIWGMLELCWKPQPGDRPSLNTVLRCLQGVTRPYVNGDVEVDADADAQTDTTTTSDSCMFLCDVQRLRLTLSHSCDIKGSMVTCPMIPDSSTLPHPTPHASIDCSRGIIGLPTDTHDDGELPVPPHGSPSIAGPMIQQDGGQLPDRPQMGNPKQGWIGGKFVRSTGKKFKTIARKSFGR
jgi:serine/threonine protein kinase